MKVFIDIETIPCQKKECIEDIKSRYPIPKFCEPKCPGNITKQESIDKWMSEKYEDAMIKAKDDYILECEKIVKETDNEYRKTALSGTTGEIVCISWAIDEMAPMAIYRNEFLDRSGMINVSNLDICANSESDLIEVFYSLLRISLNKRNPTWVGHNVFFDLRFIFQRSVIHNIRPTINLALDAKPWGDQVLDTMAMWGGVGPNSKVSLNNICKALGISTKEEDLDGEEIDGSKVWDYVKKGDILKVVHYCKQDVRRCREVYKRIMFL